MGTGWVADAFFVSFRFPNLFAALFAEGAFNSAFVPLFSKRLRAEGNESARGFAEQALAILFVGVINRNRRRNFHALSGAIDRARI